MKKIVSKILICCLALGVFITPIEARVTARTHVSRPSISRSRPSSTRSTSVSSRTKSSISTKSTTKSSKTTSKVIKNNIKSSTNKPPTVKAKSQTPKVKSASKTPTVNKTNTASTTGKTNNSNIANVKNNPVSKTATPKVYKTHNTYNTYNSYNDTNRYNSNSGFFSGYLWGSILNRNNSGTTVVTTGESGGTTVVNPNGYVSHTPSLFAKIINTILLFILCIGVCTGIVYFIKKRKK